MVNKCRGKHGAPTGGALARALYVFLGVLVAVLLSWLVSLAPWPSDAQGLRQVVAIALQGATLMLWAACKPSWGSRGSAVGEAVLVVAVALGAAMVRNLVSTGERFFVDDPAGWLFSYVFMLLIDSTYFVLAASWLLGSSQRWTQRPFWWLLGELGFAVVVVLVTHTVFPLVPNFGTAALLSVLFELALVELVAAALLQRPLYEVIRRVRGDTASAPPMPTTLSPSRLARARAACIVLCAVAVAALIVMMTLSFVFSAGNPLSPILNNASLLERSVNAEKDVVAGNVDNAESAENAEAEHDSQAQRLEAAVAQSGSSYHTTGTIVAIDADRRAFLLDVDESTEDVAQGAHVMVDCTYAETSELELATLSVGAQVSIRSVQEHANDGTIPLQRLEVSAESVATEEVPLVRPASSIEIDQVFASFGCGYRVVGTVVSPIATDGSFDLRVDGGAPIAAGEIVHVSVAELRQTLGDAGALAEGVSGVTVGYSYWLEGEVLNAKVLVVGG